MANYEPAVGYAWWLMEHMWTVIAEQSARQGRRCFLAYPTDGAVPVAVSAAGIEVFTCDLRPGSPEAQSNLPKEIRQRGITVVYLVDQAFFSLSYLAYRRAGVRVIINHDHTPGDRPPVTGLRRALKVLRNRLDIATCDIWVTVSPLMRERAIRNTLVPVERIFVVQNGISPFHSSADARLMSRQELGISEGALAIATVGRAHPYKRIDFVVRLADYISNVLGMKDVVFVYFGDGPARPDLERDASRLLPPGTLRFAGNRTDVRTLLSAFDLALHPSRGEGFSLAILEYMAAGLVTLVPDIPSVSQAITHGETGFVFPDADVRAAAELVSRLADDAPMRTRVGHQAAAVVGSQYSLQRTDHELRALLRHVLG